MLPLLNSFDFESFCLLPSVVFDDDPVEAKGGEVAAALTVTFDTPLVVAELVDVPLLFTDEGFSLLVELLGASVDLPTMVCGIALLDVGFAVVIVFCDLVISIL